MNAHFSYPSKNNIKINTKNIFDWNQLNITINEQNIETKEIIKDTSHRNAFVNFTNQMHPELGIKSDMLWRQFKKEQYKEARDIAKSYYLSRETAISYESAYLMTKNDPDAINKLAKYQSILNKTV